MALNCIKDEVTPADLLAFTCLELRFPLIVKEIAEKPHRFIDVLGEDVEIDYRDMIEAYVQDSEEAKDKELSYIDRLINDRLASEDDREIAKSLAQYLFPKLAKKHPIMHAAMNRLHNRHGLLKVLHHCSPSFTLPMSELTRFLRKPAERCQMLGEYVENGAVGALLGMMMQMPEGETVEDLKGFADCLMDGLKGPARLREHGELCRTAGRILYQLILAENEPRKRWDTLLHVMSKRDGMYVGETVLVLLLNQYGIWRSGRFYPSAEVAKRQAASTDSFTYDQVYKAKDVWLDTIRSAVAETDILRTQCGVLSMLFRWGQLTVPEHSEPRTFVDAHIKDDAWAGDFIKHFTPRHNVDEMLNFVSNGAGFAKRLREKLPGDPHAQAIAQELEQLLAARAPVTPDVGPHEGKESERDDNEEEPSSG